MKKIFAVTFFLVCIMFYALAQSEIEWIRQPTTLGPAPVTVTNPEVFNEAQLVLPGTQQVSNDLRFSELQKPDGTKISNPSPTRQLIWNTTSVKATHLLDPQSPFVIQLDSIDPAQNLWLIAGDKTCQDIVNEKKGIINLQASTAERWGKVTGTAAGEAAQVTGVWAGRTVKTVYTYTADGASRIWGFLSVFPSAFIEGFNGKTPSESQKKLQEDTKTLDVELGGKMRRERKSHEIKLNNIYYFEKGSGIAQTIFFPIETIDGKNISEIEKGKKITFNACQKTADSKLREAKLEIEFGKTTITPPEAKTECISINKCTAEIGKIFGTRFFE